MGISRQIGQMGVSRIYGSNAETAIYGVSWDKSSDPTLTRTDDSVDFTAEAGVGASTVTNDFDTAEIYKDIETVTDGDNVFVRIPKFYIKKTDGVSSKTWQVSRTQHSGFYLPACFYDWTNSVELDHIDVGAYPASLNGANLASASGEYPLVSKNIVQFREYAEANGTGYYQLDIHVYDVLATLFYVEFATLDSQSVMRGFVDGRYSSSDVATVSENGTSRIIVANTTADYYEVGQPIGIGTSQGGNQVFYGRDITSIDVYDASNMAISFDGDAVDIAAGNYLYNVGWKSGFSGNISASSGSLTSNSDGKNPCMYRGIENPWGNVWQFVDGVNINDGQAWVCDDYTDYASNLFASPYEELGYVNHDANGYTTDMGYDSDHPSVNFPINVGGNFSTYYGDYYYRNTGQRITFVGGSWHYGSTAGLSCWRLNYSSSFANIDTGGRLLKAAL